MPDSELRALAGWTWKVRLENRILAGMRKGSVNYKIVEMTRSSGGQMLERNLIDAVAATGSRKQSVERVVRSLIHVGVLRKHGVANAARNLAAASVSLAKPGDFVPSGA